MLWLIFVIVVAGVMSYLAVRTKQKRVREMVEKFPGPFALPLLGNFRFMLGSSETILKNMLWAHETYGSPSRIWVFHKPWILISDPENFQIVLKNAIEKSENYEYLRVFLGNGLITVNGTHFVSREILATHTEASEWKRNRRILSPAFNVNLMQDSFMKTFHEFNDELVRELAEHCGVEIDLWPHVFQCSSDSICVNAMGYQSEDGDKRTHKERIVTYGQKAARANLLIIERIWKPWLQLDFIFNIRNRITGDYKLFADVLSFPLQIIKKKREEMKNSILKTSSNGSGDKKLNSFIDILLTSEVYKDLPNERLNDEVLTFIRAGSETSALTTCFTLLMLAKYTDVQKRVHDELDRVFGESDRKVNSEDLNQLTLLTYCIKESLRLFPTIPFIQRVAKSDLQLKDGQVVPAGVTITLAIVLAHRNKEVFTNPNEWNPDRFQPEEFEKLHPASYIPFAGGPRNCIGANYAMLAIKVQLSTILRQYRFTTKLKELSELRIGFDIALKNYSGFKVTTERRNAQGATVTH